MIVRPASLRRLSLAASAWLIALLVLTSDAGVGIIDFFLFVYGGLALAVWCLARWIVTVRARRRSPVVTGPSWRQWSIVPICLAAGVALNALEGTRNPLFIARFRLSEPAFAREAQRLLQTPVPDELRDRRLGLFAVQRSEVVDGQVRFITASCGVIDSCGVVFAPTAAPKRFQEDTFVPIFGRWWHLYERF